MSKTLVTMSLALTLGASMAYAQNITQAPTTCGALKWSDAEQKHTTLPCPPPTATTADGKPSCGILRWSDAEQRHTVMPCVDTVAQQERAPHIGE